LLCLTINLAFEVMLHAKFMSNWSSTNTHPGQIIPAQLLTLYCQVAAAEVDLWKAGTKWHNHSDVKDINVNVNDI
jgi:hypothetical protein